MKVMNLRKLPATPAASFATLQMASEANTDIDVSNNVPEQDQILLWNQTKTSNLYDTVVE